MSSIQLSKELVADVKAVVEKHDADASDDFIMMQYMSAVTGYVLAHQDKPGMDKKAFMADLAEFTSNVYDQMVTDMEPAQPQEEAFGVWKPGQS